ncbi:MAG: Asp-tRNA(Asn)/Glu-tRNA(Gln) amidotransferase subunit GatA [Bacteroidetes bacterium]|nr:MAG: Asp-tRNA(Asn)/Glu-tRNA(Gln) amidotransferase subunit GatA [Bacteroidota bacterium]
MYHSFKEIRKAIAESKTSCVDLVNHYLKNIEAKKHLNVFLEVYAEESLAKAKEIDQKIAQGTAGKLAGMVIGIKDVLCYADHGLQASSNILAGFKSQFTATAVQRLIDEDVIIIGRQNCDEFAMGSSNESSAFGVVLNEIDNTRVAGGSSGGSAVAVQADLCLASLGSDTGGSVRQPASFCGVVGFKPTYSRISRYGLIAYASSFDVIGILAKNVEDTALLLELMSGQDNYDATVSRKNVPSYSQKLKLDYKPRIAYIRETLESDGLNEEVRKRTFEKITQLEAAGHVVESVDFPLLEYILPTYYILTTAEASTNLSRFDGVRFGHRSEKATDLESMYKLSRSEGFGEEVKRRIMLGTFVLSANYYDAYFTKAQKVRRLIKEKTAEILQKYDFIMSPTAPTTAFKIGTFFGNPLQMYLADIFSVQANVVGIPAVSVPNGFDNAGLPIGLQVMANAFEEEKLLAFSQYLMEN